ncbi:MAG: hypothetical protein AAGF92_17305 [Myxococcota bacterium]
MGFGLCVLQGCIGGQVLYSDQTPVSGLQVDIWLCDGCPVETDTTDAAGYFKYDSYEDGGPLDPTQLADEILIDVKPKHWVTVEGPINKKRNYCNFTERVVQTHTPDWQYDPDTEKFYTVVPVYVGRGKIQMGPADSCPFVFSPYEENFPADNDLDGLPNSVEFAYGTDANNPDSDGDGINDHLEARGTEVEYGRGAPKFAWKRQRITVDWEGRTVTFPGT